MSILIGGPPSSGSSLLCQVLNRHSQLYCGPETSLFCKTNLYDNWNQSKLKILTKGALGLVNPGWHRLRGTAVLNKEFKLNRDIVKELIQKSSSFSQFSNYFFEGILKSEQKQVWIEKTPDNVFCFSAFLRNFKKSKVICTVRDPYDLAASLVQRKYTPYQAVARCLNSTMMSLRYLDELDFYYFKYEDFVSSPESYLKNLCQFLEIEYENEMLTPQSKKQVQIAGWRFAESEAVQKPTDKRFKELTNSGRQLIISYFENLNINYEFQKKYGLKEVHIQKYCETFGYDYISTGNSMASKRVILLNFFEQIKRIIKLYPSQKWIYPIKFVK